MYVLRQPLQHFYEYLPDVVDSLQFYPFTGRVGLHNAWSDTRHLDAGIVLYEESSFQHKVHGYHARTPAQYIVEGVAGQSQEVRLLVFPPGWCRHDGLRGGTMLLECIRDVVAQCFHLAVDEAACMRTDEDMTLFCDDTSHIVRRLYRILHGVTHFHHALWNLFQNTQ